MFGQTRSSNSINTQKKGLMLLFIYSEIPKDLKESWTCQITSNRTRKFGRDDVWVKMLIKIDCTLTKKSTIQTRNSTWPHQLKGVFKVHVRLSLSTATIPVLNTKNACKFWKPHWTKELTDMSRKLKKARKKEKH